MLRIRREKIVTDLQTIRNTADEWAGTFQGNLPALDRPGSQDDLQQTVREFCAELILMAQHLETMAGLLSDDSG